MKKYVVNIMMLFSLPLFVATSCDNFERTEVEYTITVNHNSVTLFEGETKIGRASCRERVYSCV